MDASFKQKEHFAAMFDYLRRAVEIKITCGGGCGDGRSKGCC